ncbi:MAG: hypothetical protein ACTSQI_08570 [Candidatus Helarchaeota archaeon]
MIFLESLSDKNKIWQIDEILLILLASGRFHNITDLLLLTKIFERVFPDSNLIGFKGNNVFISRQIESLKKRQFIFAIGKNVGISAEGRKYTIQILNNKILMNKELAKFWQLYRKMLAHLPRVRGMWEKSLENFLRRLNG